jgi:molybdopterin-binding protein
VPIFRIKEAAELLGVSGETIRRWIDKGRVPAIRDASGRLAVDGAALARLAQDLAEELSPGSHGAAAGHSMRNRFTGLITRVTRDGVIAQVEIQAGPHHFVSLISRDAAEDLGLAPGMLAVAAMKSTEVSLEISEIRTATPAEPI